MQWSPCGRRVVYLSNTHRAVSDIVTLDVISDTPSLPPLDNNANQGGTRMRQVCMYMC